MIQARAPRQFIETKCINGHGLVNAVSQSHKSKASLHIPMNGISHHCLLFASVICFCLGTIALVAGEDIAMKQLQVILAVTFALAACPAFAADAVTPTSGIPSRYAMILNGVNRSHIPNPVIQAACTGANTCCCKAGSQIFCTTPGACSQMGGACSAGCN